MAGKRKQETPRGTARDRLIAAADALFTRDGIAATPVDRAVSLAGVATMTLYHHFDGKDGLVVAYLQYRHERWMKRWQHHVDQASSEMDRALAVFDALAEWAESGELERGCAFVDAAAEITDRGHPAWQVIELHKKDLRERLVELTRAAGAQDPTTTGDQLLLLYEGALTGLLIGHISNPVAAAHAVARGILR